MYHMRSLVDVARAPIGFAVAYLLAGGVASAMAVESGDWGHAMFAVIFFCAFTAWLFQGRRAPRQ